MVVRPLPRIDFSRRGSSLPDTSLDACKCVSSDPLFRVQLVDATMQPVVARKFARAGDING